MYLNIGSRIPFFIITLSIATFSLLSPVSVQAQTADAGEILRSGSADSNLLLRHYLKPFGSGFGSNLNTGWFNSALPNTSLGIDFRVNAAIAFVPDADQSFDISELDLTTIEASDPNNTITPTAFGEDETGPQVRSVQTYEGEPLFEFNLPEGTGFPYVPSPMAQLTVGISHDTDVSLRLIPKINIEDTATLKLWGIGVKHGINQWFPGGESLPFDLSVQFGYTSLTTTADFDVQPEVDSETFVPEGYEPESQRWEGQSFDLSTSAYTANILIGKSFQILTLYGGVGLHGSSMNIKTPGSYPVIVPNTDDQGNFTDPERPKRVDSIDDPIDIDLDEDQTVRALAGLRLNLGFFVISGTYTHSKYPVGNVGVGFSF